MAAMGAAWHHAEFAGLGALGLRRHTMIILSTAAFQITLLELKLLLLLLSFPGYRAPLAQIHPQANLSMAARDRLCYQLQQKGLIECEDSITRFGITATGRTLLSLDTSVLPVTPDEKSVLRSCQEHSITPSQIHPSVPPNLRQVLIAGLQQFQIQNLTVG
jgi:hypothetical protein